MWSVCANNTWRYTRRFDVYARCQEMLQMLSNFDEV